MAIYTSYFGNIKNIRDMLVLRHGVDMAQYRCVPVTRTVPPWFRIHNTVDATFKLPYSYFLAIKSGELDLQNPTEEFQHRMERYASILYERYRRMHWRIENATEDWFLSVHDIQRMPRHMIILGYSGSAPCHRHIIARKITELYGEVVEELL